MLSSMLVAPKAAFPSGKAVNNSAVSEGIRA